MSGKRGRSGRKMGSGKGSGMSAVEHAARGTYRPSLHGPLPPGVVPIPRRPVLVKGGAVAAPAFVVPRPTPAGDVLTAADCPAVLDADGRALWGAVVSSKPTDRMLGPFVAMFVEASLAWRRATSEVQKRQDLVKVGNRPVPNPYLKMRREAEATMFRVAGLLGWQPSPVYAADALPDRAKSRLELFLSARSGT